MRHFHISIDINAPADRVWAVMSDVDHWQDWTPSISRITWLGQAGLAVGHRVLIRQPRFPPALWRVSDIVPGRSFTWVSTAPGLRVIGHHAVTATPTGARATLSLELQGLFGSLWGRLTAGTTRRYINLEARGLKARSENPGWRHEQQAA